MIRIENFLNKEGKIKAWPSKHEAKSLVLRHVGNRFDTGRFYAEKEVNRIIDENHTFGDYFLLRRGMVDCGVMRRTPDGSRYWRGGLWAEANGAETGRMTIRAATPEDAEDIGDVYNACAYMAEWTGEEHDEAGLASLLEGSDLPPGGSREFNHLAVMRKKEGGGIAGIADYYTAWPAENCIWIGLMLIHPDCQKLGYGSEFVEAFISESKRQAYRQVGLGVALRNQPALKFWVKSGFDRIDKVVPDGEAGAGRLAVIGLHMVI